VFSFSVSESAVIMMNRCPVIPLLAGGGVGQGELVVGVTGECPIAVVNQVMMEPAQPGQIGHGRRPALGEEHQMMHLVDRRGARVDAAFSIPQHHRLAQVCGDGLQAWQCCHELAIAQDHRLDRGITGQQGGLR